MIKSSVPKPRAIRVGAGTPESGRTDGAGVTVAVDVGVGVAVAVGEGVTV